MRSTSLRPTGTSKKQKFWNLQQGTKTVVEYDRTFTQLARYAPQLVDTEEKRVSKFGQGLRPEIGMPLAGQGDLTYAQTLARALTIEGMIPKKPTVAAPTAPTFKRHWDGPHNPRNVYPRQFQQGGPSRPPVHPGSFRPNQGRALPPHCQNCKKQHFGHCPPKPVTCYRCGQAGHIRPNCPQNTQHNQAPAPPRQAAPSGQPARRPNGQRPPQNARPYALNGEEVDQEPGVLAGMIPVNGTFILALFDTGATHSFISCIASKILGLAVS